MNGYLLDTNILSELRKGARANRNVLRWAESVEPDGFFVSVLVLGEVRRGVESLRRRDEASADAIERWLARVMRAYASRILPVDAAVTDRWGRLDAAARLPTVDGLVAATALVHGLVLVTRNVKDVRGTGVPVIDPFTTTVAP